MADFKPMELIIMAAMVAVGWFLARRYAKRPANFDRPILEKLGEIRGGAKSGVRFTLHRLQALPDQRSIGLEVQGLEGARALLLTPQAALALAEQLEQAAQLPDANS